MLSRVAQCVRGSGRRYAGGVLYGVSAGDNYDVAHASVEISPTCYIQPFAADNIPQSTEFAGDIATPAWRRRW